MKAFLMFTVKVAGAMIIVAALASVLNLRGLFVDPIATVKGVLNPSTGG